jgi:hypothetical protein
MSTIQKPWCYDSLFDSVRRNWDAHNKTCQSLRHFWLGRRGGRSCPSDLTDCGGCGATFFNEGVTDVNWDSTDPDAEPDYRCECCTRPSESSPPKSPRAAAAGD